MDDHGPAPDDDPRDAIRDLEATVADWRDDGRAFRALALGWYDVAGAAGTGADDAAGLTLLGDRAMARARDVGAVEEASLVLLNSALILSGREAGEATEVNGTRYLVEAEGRPCARLGPAVPPDGPRSDPEWSDRDELRERMFEYNQMVHFNLR